MDKYETAIKLHDEVLAADTPEAIRDKLDELLGWIVNHFVVNTVSYTPGDNRYYIYTGPQEGLDEKEHLETRAMFQSKDILAQYRDIPPTLLDAVLGIAIVRDLVILSRPNRVVTPYYELKNWHPWCAKFSRLILTF